MNLQLDQNIVEEYKLYIVYHSKMNLLDINIFVLLNYILYQMNMLDIYHLFDHKKNY